MSPSVRGTRTFLQTLIGLLVGLALAIWHVPGVPGAIHSYVIGNEASVFATLTLLVGLPAGIVSWIHNKYLTKSPTSSASAGSVETKAS
jgi:hypothetical protein